jgi:hypothetical protein
VIALVGTLNPSSGDVSVFLPLEHTVLAQAAEPQRRTARFARYSLAGALAGAAGTLAAVIPDLAVERTDLTHLVAMQAMFWLYGALGALAFLLYRPLSPAVEALPEAPPAPLRQSRGIVYGLAVLFSIDSFGGGFFVQSLLVLWLYQAYDLSVTTAASILFWSSIFSAISYLLAVPISARFGLINTMVFTHLPSNIFLMLVPFAPKPSDGDRPVARPQRLVTDGCPDADLLRHGRGDPAGTASSSKPDLRSTKLRVGIEPVARRLSPDPFEFRLAATTGCPSRSLRVNAGGRGLRRLAPHQKHGLQPLLCCFARVMLQLTNRPA